MHETLAELLRELFLTHASGLQTTPDLRQRIYEAYASATGSTAEKVRTNWNARVDGVRRSNMRHLSEANAAAIGPAHSSKWIPTQ